MLFLIMSVDIALWHVLFSMLKTLERYQKCSYNAMEPSVSAKEAALVRSDTVAQSCSYSSDGLVTHEVEFLCCSC